MAECLPNTCQASGSIHSSKRGGKKEKTGTLEMAKSVKHLLHKHGDLSSDPGTDIKARQGVICV